jgi:hypothetical protein
MTRRDRRHYGAPSSLQGNACWNAFVTDKAATAKHVTRHVGKQDVKASETGAELAQAPMVGIERITRPERARGHAGGGGSTSQPIFA